MSEEEESPQELVQSAADHIDTSKEHEQRARELAQEAEDRVREEVSEMLPDSYLVDVEAMYDGADTGLVVSVFDESVEEAVDEVVDVDVDVGFKSSQEVLVGDVELDSTGSKRERIRNIRGIIANLEDRYDEGVPVEKVKQRAERVGIGPSKAEHEIEKLKQKGEVYEPRTDHLRTT